MHADISTEKKQATVATCIPLSVEAALRVEVDSCGLSMSELLCKIACRHVLSQCLHGKPASHPLLADIHEVLTEAQMALVDGRIDQLEKARLTKPLARALDRVWNPKTSRLTAA